MEKVFVLKGLDCPHCSAKIEKEVGTLAGVSSSSVNLIKQTLTVTADRRSISAGPIPVRKRKWPSGSTRSKNGSPVMMSIWIGFL